MKILLDVKGLCMELVKPRQGDTKRQVRVFQEGNPDLVTVTVTNDTYSKVKAMTPIEIKNCLVDMYAMRNDDGSTNHGMYCKEQF